MCPEIGIMIVCKNHLDRLPLIRNCSGFDEYALEESQINPILVADQ